jgi:hypothetical protein
VPTLFVGMATDLRKILNPIEAVFFLLSADRTVHGALFKSEMADEVRRSLSLLSSVRLDKISFGGQSNPRANLHPLRVSMRFSNSSLRFAASDTSPSFFDIQVLWNGWTSFLVLVTRCRDVGGV